jgi:hypothetical protein
MVFGRDAFCNEALELAGRFMERAFDACEVNGEEDVIGTRNAMIRAQKELSSIRLCARNVTKLNPNGTA